MPDVPVAGSSGNGPHQDPRRAPAAAASWDYYRHQIELTDSGHASMVQPSRVGLVSQTISIDAGSQFAAVVPAAVIRKTIAIAVRK